MFASQTLAVCCMKYAGQFYIHYICLQGFIWYINSYDSKLSYSYMGNPGLILGLRPANERRRYKSNAISHWLGANLESALVIIWLPQNSYRPIYTLHLHSSLGKTVAQLWFADTKHLRSVVLLALVWIKYSWLVWGKVDIHLGWCWYILNPVLELVCHGLWDFVTGAGCAMVSGHLTSLQTFIYICKVHICFWVVVNRLEKIFNV